MTAGFQGQQGYIAATSEQLSHADLNAPGSGRGEDHAAHASGKVCKSCGQPIEAGQPARRRGETEWSHDVCPLMD